MTEKLSLSATRNSGNLVDGVDGEEKNMDERTVKRIPRMRTASKIVAEIKALDPGSEVTEYFVRQLVKDGAVNPTWAGNKALINLDDVLDILRSGTIRTKASCPVIDGIRRVDVHMRPGTKETTPGVTSTRNGRAVRT